MDSWAYRWTATCWKRGAFSANAARNLVSNIGFGRDATHTRGGAWGELPTRPQVFPLRHPAEVSRDVGADAAIGKKVFSPPSLWTRVLRRWQRLFA